MIYNFENLTEVKKNTTGTGLLIENDGRIQGNDDLIKQVNEDMRTGKKFVIPEHFVVSAVFQKYGIKNANGRIYPENVLKKEVEKYMTKVHNHNALGALDHPSCQLADTLVLTKTGWKQICDIKVGEEVLSVTPDKKIEIKRVTRVINEPYEGKMIHLKGRFIDLTVTPNHKFPVLDRNKKWKGFYQADDILCDLIPDQGHCSLFRTGEWEGDNDEYFTVPALESHEVEGLNSNLRDVYSKPLVVPMDVWMKFMGIYLSEGDCNYIREDGKRNGRVSIHQVKEETTKEIEAMLEEFPLDLHKGVIEDKEHDRTKTTFSFYDLRLSKYLSQFGKCYDKYVPYDIKRQNKEMLRIFYDWFVMGDGRQRGLGPGNYYSDDVFSTSKRLVMDLNEIQLKIGYCGVYHEEDRKHDRMIEGRLIKGENSQNMHFSFRSLTKHLSLNKKSLDVTQEDYKGNVYCLEVEDNHTFYTMDKTGHCLWSGNSSTLSGHDVSHNILDLRWEGRTLVGEMELQLSPGYIRYGVCSTSGDLVANMILSGYLIGVSSRGVGSVEQSLGQYMVQDDFELIGWDVVLEPSTSGSWIGRDMKDLQQYVEGEERCGSPILEKLEHINSILES